MKRNDTHTTSRRTFLQTCAAGVTAAGSNIGFAAQTGSSTSDSSSAPALRLEADAKRSLVPVLSWDTEGGERVRSNLLSSPGLGLQVLTEGRWRDGTDFPATVQPLGNGTRYLVQAAGDGTLQWDISPARDSFEMTVSAVGPSTLRPPMRARIVFPFDARQTPTTVLPSVWNEDGSFEAPLLISAPDFGQVLMRVTPGARMTGRLEGNRRALHTVELVVELPPLSQGDKYAFSFTPVTLAAPPELRNSSMWRLARRGWFNAFQPAACWGEPNTPGIGVPGVLSNNVISDACSFALGFYADHMLWTPQLSEGISAARLVAQSVEFWLKKRTRSNGEVVGYSDYGNFLDANAGPVIAAWDYVEAAGDLTWLERMMGYLEYVADFSARRDVDHDGLVEATQTGNVNTFAITDRSSNWFDAVNYGHKDGYANALIYRAWRCLEDLEAKLHREDQRARYTQLADRLKAAYAGALYNPRTGWIACWRSADSALHDYACPVVNGLAIEYGLVEPQQGRSIVDRLWAKMQSVGFTRFELGIPSTLEPIHRSDYGIGGFGCPSREDGTDTFQQYENGGISAGRIQHFLAACYLVGRADHADRVLTAMLARQQVGGFQNGVQDELPKGVDWTTWEGKSCGYEGYLADNYTFLLSVLLREPGFRRRYYRPLSAA